MLVAAGRGINRQAQRDVAQGVKVVAGHQRREGQIPQTKIRVTMSRRWRTTLPTVTLAVASTQMTGRKTALAKFQPFVFWVQK